MLLSLCRSAGAGAALCNSVGQPRAVHVQVSYRERMAAVGRMPTTLSRNEQGENLREAATANAIECALQALLPPGIACPMQVRHLRSSALPKPILP